MILQVREPETAIEALLHVSWIPIQTFIAFVGSLGCPLGRHSFTEIEVSKTGCFQSTPKWMVKIMETLL